MLDGQMVSLMRSSLEQQGVNMVEVVQRHGQVVEALRSRRVGVIRDAIRDHYMMRKPSGNGTG